MNGTVPCLEDTVERGVLARVVAELLLIDKSVNQQCGVCSSSQFAAAYLGEKSFSLPSDYKVKTNRFWRLRLVPVATQASVS